jgi:malate permease and related proteins
MFQAMNLLSVVVPIFGLIFIGWLLMRIGLFPPWLVKAVNDYVYYIGITVITFLSLHDTSLSLLLDPWIYLITIIPIVAVVLIAFAVARLMKLERAAIPVFIVCAFFGNTGYIGFPLNIAVQGRESLALTAFISTIYTVIVFTFGAYLCQRYSDKNEKVLRLHKIPVFWAAAAGIGLSFIALPGIARVPLVFIEDSTSPLALLATGAMISAVGIKENLKPIGAISAIKLLVMPAIVLVTAVVAGISGTVSRTSLLEAATPVGVTNTVLAEQFGLDAKLASSAVVVSTALFFVTITLILLLF